MIKKFSKILLITLSLFMVTLLSVNAVATTHPSENITDSLIGLFASDGTNSYRSGEVPFREYQISSGNPYYFSGTSGYQNLYTLYCFTGCSTYMVVVNNNNTERAQTVECISKTTGAVIYSFNVPAGGRSAFHVNTTELWYLKFVCTPFATNCDVSGTVYATVENRQW